MSDRNHQIVEYQMRNSENKETLSQSQHTFLGFSSLKMTQFWVLIVIKFSFFLIKKPRNKLQQQQVIKVEHFKTQKQLKKIIK